MSAGTAAGGMAALQRALREQGGTLAEHLAPGQPNGDGPQRGLAEQLPGPAQLAASGPRARGREREYELLLEMILEGSLLHYGRPRVLHPPDADLALLLGDQLYALGLSRLAQLGDLEAVAELADLISLLAAAQAAGAADLADAIWLAGAAAIGWGAGPEHAAAKALARSGDPSARAALEAAAQGAANGGRGRVDCTLRCAFDGN